MIISRLLRRKSGMMPVMEKNHVKLASITRMHSESNKLKLELKSTRLLFHNF